MGGRKQERRSRKPRGWCLPTAMLRDPRETLEGARLLAESDGVLGLLLWQTFRDVVLWAGTPFAQHAHLFADGSAKARTAQLAATELPPPIAAAVDTIHGMLTLAGGADVSILSICCLEVATWAGREGLVHTAVDFAQAGALVDPDFAEAALHTGIFASAAGQRARAETWLRRAVGLARLEEDRAAYAVALVELGVIREARGDLAGAKTFYDRGYKAGRRFSSWSARLRAAHGLFRLARRRGDDQAAANSASLAQRAYRADVHGGPDLLLDLAQFWVGAGAYARARGVLRRLLPARAGLGADGRLLTAALAARANAPVRDQRPAARRAAAEAWELMHDESVLDATRLAAAWHLAHGARIMRDLEAFTRAKRAVLTLVPRDAYPGVVGVLADLWPEDRAGEAPRQLRS